MGMCRVCIAMPLAMCRVYQVLPAECHLSGRELELVFDKSDFARMEIIGQFNLGFIVARLRDDLFIVDQHASGTMSLCASPHEMIFVTVGRAQKGQAPDTSQIRCAYAF